MKNISLKNEFNELIALDHFLTAFQENFDDGNAIADKISLAQRRKLADRIMERAEADDDSGFLAEREIFSARKKGVDVLGYEESIRVYTAFMKAADENLGVLIDVIGVDVMRSISPQVSEKKSVKQYAARRELKNIEMILG